MTKIEKQLKNIRQSKESKIEKALVSLILRCGGSPVKIQGVGNKSMPDRLCLFPGGLVWFVETKKQGKKPDKLQLFTLAKLRAMGFPVSVISTTEQLKQFENEISAAQLSTTCVGTYNRK